MQTMEISSVSYVVAGSPAALAHGIGEVGQCAECGARLLHCWVTERGVFGGDCLATLTGIQVSRRVTRRVLDRLSRLRERAHVVRVRVEEQRSAVAEVRVGWDSWHGRSITEDRVIDSAIRGSLAFVLSVQAACEVLGVEVAI